MSQTILIADDSKTVRTIVTMAFKASGYDVAEQGEGASVLSTVQNSRPDVLILDYFFPDGDGYEICRELKENPATADVPILMLGGKYKQFNEGLARTSGADAILIKPFKTDALLDAVEEAKTKAVENAKKRGPVAAQKPVGGPAPLGGNRFGAAPPASPGGNRFGSAGGGFGAPNSPTGVPNSPMGAQSAGAPPASPAAPPFSPATGNSSVSFGAAPQNNFGAPPAQPAAHKPAAGFGSPAASPQFQTPQTQAPQPPHDAPVAAATGGGISADQVREIVREEIAAFVKDELPTLVQNVLGGPIQRKLLYKMIARADERYDEVVRGAVHNQVIIEIEKLLNETN